MIFESYVNGKNIAEITKLLYDQNIYHIKGRVFNKSFVWKILRNPVYMGKFLVKDKLYPAQHKAIISEEIFNHAQSFHKKPHKKVILGSAEKLLAL